MRATSIQLRRVAAAALLAVSAFAFAADDAATTILPDTYGTVVIGDVQGLLDKIGALASKVVPGVTGDMLKQRAGAMLGDPQLAGLPPGSGIAVVIPKQGLPYGFIEVAADKLDDYETQLKKQPMARVEKADGLIVVGANPAGLDAAKAIASKVKSSILAGDGAPTVAAAIKLADVLKQYDAQIQSGISAASQRLQQANAATSGTVGAQPEMIEGVLRMYYAIAKRIDVLELNLAPTADAFSLNYYVTPVGGTSTSTSVAEGSSPADLLKLLPGSGAVRAQVDFDMGSMAKTVSEVVHEVDKANTVNAQALDEWMKAWSEAFTGATAASFLPDPDQPVSGCYALTCKSEEAALKFQAEMPQKLKDVGFFKLYQSLGMPMTMDFKENVRKYKDTPIHRLSIKLSMDQMPSEQSKRFKAMFGDSIDYDIAIVNKVMFFAKQPTKIDDLIDAAKAGSNPSAKPLISAEKLPSGGRGYTDYNIGEVMMFAANMTAKQNSSTAVSEQLQKLSSAVKDAPPIQIGWYDLGGRYRLLMKMPAETLQAFVQAGQAISASGSHAGAQRPTGSEMEEDESTSSTHIHSSGPRARQQRMHK